MATITGNNKNFQGLLKKIDLGIIPPEVYEQEDSLENKQKANINKAYGSVKNYLVVLYYLIFVEKREKSEAARFLGINPTPVHLALYNLGWSYSNDWDENKRLKEEDMLAGIQKREAAKKIRLEDNQELHELMMQTKRYTNKTKFKHFSSEEEYLKVLLYYSCIQKLTRKQLVPIMGDSYGTIYQRLKNFGINLTVEEGMHRKKANKTQDYTNTRRASNNTKRSSQLKNQSFGSSSANELYARNYLADNINIYFSPEEYDVIVGCSNTGILGQKEIDIPIIIFNKNNNELYRIAFEYNGAVWHTEEEDTQKRELAEGKGWIYVRLIDKAEYSNDRTKLNQALHQVMKDLQALLYSTPNSNVSIACTSNSIHHLL